MKVPLVWLREHCDPPLDTAQIEERLTMTGTKVEAVLHALEQPIYDAELAGEPGMDTDVLELEITPNRPDCLGVYGVARELHAASGAPLAPEPWAEDPGSPGPLGAGVAAGEEPAPDVRAQGRASALRAGTAVPAPAEVVVRCPELCRRFTARVFEDVEVAPSPPWLKARLTAAGQRPINNVVDVTNYAMLETGQPLHAFDLDRVAGGRLTVRRARAGEQVQTLDGQTRTLDEQMVLIEDDQGPTSIAGVMGGERSEVGPETRRVLMEVANWSGPNIHRTSWTLGLRSEASARFEKDLAPEQCMHAQALASRLMIEICKARLLPGTIDVRAEQSAAGNGAGAAASSSAAAGRSAVSPGASSPGAVSPSASPPPASPPDASTAAIRLRERRVQEILGMPVARERQSQILAALGFGAQEAPDGLDVTVPAVRRNDVAREIDLVEEVARIHGLAQLPATLPARRGAYGRLSPAQRARRRAVDALVGRGLYEVLGWTFSSPSLLDRLRLPAEDARRDAPVLENPLSEDQSLLRTTLLGGLLDAAQRNAARGMPDARLFELGTVFAGAPSRAAGEHALRETGVRERQMLAVLLAGDVTPATWQQPHPPRAGLFAVKAVLEALAEALSAPPIECRQASEPFLHPGRAAAVTYAGERIGWLGELHPLVASEWDLEAVAAFEVELAPLLAAAGEGVEYRDAISFPALRQDIAVVLRTEVPAAQALAEVRAAGGALLDDAFVFDVYSGAQVGEGRRSLALALSFRAPDRTLSDEEVAPVRERIVAALADLGGELRG